MSEERRFFSPAAEKNMQQVFSRVLDGSVKIVLALINLSLYIDF
jgi:hypothetical protein